MRIIWSILSCVIFSSLSSNCHLWVLFSSSKITPPSSPVSLKQQSRFLPSRITVWNVRYCSGFSTQSVPPPSKKAQAQDQDLVLSCPTVCPAACRGHRKHSVKRRITQHAYTFWLGRANCENLQCEEIQWLQLKCTTCVISYKCSDSHTLGSNNMT